MATPSLTAKKIKQADAKLEQNIHKIKIATSSDNSPSDVSRHTVKEDKWTMTDNEILSSTSVQPGIDSNEQCEVSCVKHATNKISSESSILKSQNLKLCNPCSKSMLKYINIMQNFLTSLASEIAGENVHCEECLTKDERSPKLSIPKPEADPVIESRDAVRKGEDAPKMETDGFSGKQRAENADFTQKDSQIKKIPAKDPVNEQEDKIQVAQQKSGKEPIEDKKPSSNYVESKSQEIKSVPRKISKEETLQSKPQVQQISLSNAQSEKASSGVRRKISSGSSTPKSGLDVTKSQLYATLYPNRPRPPKYDEPSDVDQSFEHAGSSYHDEAFVTIAHSNEEAVGALVLGSSLRNCETEKGLCVLVNDGVSSKFKSYLSRVYDKVIHTRDLDTRGTNELNLLSDPEMAIDFDKFNAWRVDGYKKCVYMNPETLVINNCDEIFNYQELSAVPDSSWPDNLNNSVFVYKPSEETFWKLIDFAKENGDYGEPAVFNLFFDDWKNHLDKHISFRYNIIADSSYTYAPAAKRFGGDAKIINFATTPKPWDVKFDTSTLKRYDSNEALSRNENTLELWLKVFLNEVSARHFPQEVEQKYADTDVASVTDVLDFFTPSETSTTAAKMSYPFAAPSLRLNFGSGREPKFLYLHDQQPEEVLESENSTEEVPESQEVTEETSEIEKLPEDGTAEVSKSSTDTATKSVPEDKTDPKVVPLDDMQRRLLWEQGRMDYTGTESSENILKKLNLQFKK